MLKKLFLISLLIVSFSNTALAIEFSADTITTMKGGQKMEGKMYFKPDKFRIDMKTNEDMIMITRIDKKVVWNMMIKQKSYMEMPFDLKNKPKVEEKYPGEIERKEVGRETIDGHPTIKYLITYKIDDKKNQVYQWLATDIKFPIKTAGVDGSWTQEFRNVKVVAQPDSLFEVPPGYTKMQMPQMPGGGMNLKRQK
jgi:Domain of unknown function (DUF4412)